MMIRDTLRSILSSSFPPNMLDNVVDSLIDNDSSLTLDDQHVIFHICLRLVRDGNNPQSVDIGWKILHLLEKKHDTCFDVLLTNQTIIDIFKGNEPSCNPVEVPRLVGWCLKRRCNPGLEQTVKHCLTDFLHTVQCDERVLAAMCKLLNEHKSCVPNDDELRKFCEALVASLSSLSMPAAEAEAIRTFQENILVISAFLQTAVLNASNSEKIIFACLNIVCNAIANKDDGREPCPVLSVVLELVESSAVSNAVQMVLKNSSSYHDIVTKAMQVFCHWVTIWPKAAHVSEWVIALIIALETRSEFEILNDITLETIESLFGAMVFPALRHGVESIVWRMLFSSLHNHQVFHKIAPKIPNVLNQLKRENDRAPIQSSQIILNYCMIMKEVIPDFAKDYDNLNKLLEGFTCERRLCKEVIESRIMQWTPNMTGAQPVFLSSPSVQVGRVGLSNLGNTCYMNSVLQALFMTSKFCFGLLAIENSRNNIVMGKLQSLFALLLHSRRPALSPSELYAVCRPPGFIPGHQQDSSEFLIYLLNVLHGQSETASMKPGKIVPTVVTVDIDCKASGDNKVESDDTAGSISRWTTEEDLSAGTVLERKSLSLADCSKDGNESEKIEALSSTLSGSADSGIHSVCGEDSGNVAPSSDQQNTSLVHQIFGGKIVTCNKCLTCSSESVRTDTFTDMQLAFPPQHNSTEDEMDVQLLLNYFVSPENLSGDNSYQCDKCCALQDGKRTVSILQAPSHLILTIKHFHYDSSTMQRTKLLHKVHYNQQLEVPIVAAGQQQAHLETYRLYAAVIHSGKSVDSGHYYTFSRDRSGCWFVFNDETVCTSSLEELTNLKPPNTPYILFYIRPSEKLQPEIGNVSPEQLQRHLLDLVHRDNMAFAEEKLREERRRSLRRMHTRSDSRKPDDDPPSSCGGGSSFGTPSGRFVC